MFSDKESPNMGWCRPRSGPFGVIGGVYGGLLSHGVRRGAAPRRDVNKKMSGNISNDSNNNI